jgi:phytanoyl-CoA dioxygenase PhyH
MVVDPRTILQTFGFVILRQFFDPEPLAAEIDRVMLNSLSSRIVRYEGISFQYVPMMTAETPVSLSLLDRSCAAAEALLGGPVIPTRAKGTVYRGNTPWHTDSESPITSIGFIAYLESLEAENGALQVLPGSHQQERGDAITAERQAQVIETEPGDMIVIEEHLFHASFGGGVRRQWRVDYLLVPADADAEKHTKAYFERIYPPDWDGGYDVDRYPSYGSDFRESGRPCVAQLEALGVYDLAGRQEAFARSRR